MNERKLNRMQFEWRRKPKTIEDIARKAEDKMVRRRRDEGNHHVWREKRRINRGKLPRMWLGAKEDWWRQSDMDVGLVIHDTTAQGDKVK